MTLFRRGRHRANASSIRVDDLLAAHNWHLGRRIVVLRSLDSVGSLQEYVSRTRLPYEAERAALDIEYVSQMAALGLPMPQEAA